MSYGGLCKTIVASLVPIVLASCGTYVPDVQENPFATQQQKSDFVQAIARNIRCEVQDAIIKIYAENNVIDPQNRNLSWFDPWAAQIALTLTTDEKGIFSPSANVLPPSPPSRIFNLALGVTASSEAQRINKVGYLFTVAELKSLHSCDPAFRNRGPFILESDLKLYDWLQAMMVSNGNYDTPFEMNANGAQKTNVFSHEVKFDIVTSGSLTPGWKLTTATVNQNGNLFTGSRGRTQDLTITFGPVDPTWSKPVIDPITKKPKRDQKTGKILLQPTLLSPIANNDAFSSQIAVDLGNSIRNAIRP